jgi:hypothetical protein
MAMATVSMIHPRTFLIVFQEQLPFFNFLMETGTSYCPLAIETSRKENLALKRGL